MKIYCAGRDSSDLALVTKIAGKNIWVKVCDIETALYYYITGANPDWPHVRTFSWIKIVSIEPFSTDPDKIFVELCFVNHNPYVEYPRKLFLSTYREITGRHKTLPLSCIKFVQPIEMASTDELFTILEV